MARISTKDWRSLPTEKWNVTTFHAFLIERNKELYGIDYEPFGRGSVSTRWMTEKGQIKTAQGNYGNTVLRRYIEKCFENHRYNPKYPTLAFGFMLSYMRNELSQAQAEVASEERSKAAQQDDMEAIDGEDIGEWL